MTQRPAQRRAQVRARLLLFSVLVVATCGLVYELISATMASYLLEGFLRAAMSDTEAGRTFRARYRLYCVPIVDKDGVQSGDQGKNRNPHDHNRDYEGESIYASVAANKEFVPEWSNGKLRIVLDLHCPYVRGGGGKRGSNEQIYFVGGSDRSTISKNPGLEIFRKNDIEVLYLTDPVDEIVLSTLEKFGDKQIVSIDSA